jgi:tRNA 2-thiocytidine biosynthesis protein TtcA
MQRVAIKKMLADWERDFPGRTESIFSALRHVEVEHLADPRHFNFVGLEGQRVAEMTAAEEEALESRLESAPALA